ncbi:MAG TPA: 50S ribosomal protein L29 [Candidatus Azoamicus sp. OHIO2]
MKTTHLNEKSLTELNIYLVILYKKKLKLLLEKTNGSEFKNSHVLKSTKKYIARTLTIINEKKRDNI